mgnify:FL=1
MARNNNINLDEAGYNTDDKTKLKIDKNNQDIILDVKNLQVDFHVGKNTMTAIKNVNFQVAKGKTLGIVGESGCGKSVTANSIMRLFPKTVGEIADGSIIYEGRDIVKMTDSEIREIRGNRISMIFQDPMTALNPVYKIGEQLMEILFAHQNISKKEAFERCVNMLEKVGIPAARQRMKEYPHELSGGMRQRVMIAMALLTNPDILIADEPTTALDVTIQAQVLELIEELKKEYNTAVLFITHDMGVIADIADYVMVMYAGEIVEYDTTEGLFEKPLHPYTYGLLKSIPKLYEDIDRLYTIEGVVPALNEMPDGCRFSTRCEYCTEKCKREKPPLINLSGEKKVACFRYV